MKKKLTILFAAYHIVFAMVILVALFGGKFTETVTLQYTSVGNTEGELPYELTGDEELTFRFKQSVKQMNNLIFRFSGCQNHESGVLNVRIYNGSEEYYVYEVPTYAFQEDVFYLCTNEIPTMQGAKGFDVTVKVAGLSEGSIYLHGSSVPEMATADGQISPVWGVEADVTQLSGMLGDVLLAWVILDVCYIIVAWLLVTFLTHERKQALVKRIKSLERAYYIRMGVLVALCVVAVVAVPIFGDEMQEEQTYEYWTHHNISEYLHIPLKDGEVLQSFTAGYDHMEKFILWFDHYAQDDGATVSVTLEDKNGEVYYDWRSSTANFKEDLFCLVAYVEKELQKNHTYYLRISSDSPTSNITTRGVWEDEIHPSVDTLTIGGVMQDELLVYFFQSYRHYVSYAAIWGYALGITCILFLFVVFGKRKQWIKVWNVVSVFLLLVVCYYNTESLSGNLQTIRVPFVLVNCMILLAIYLVIKAVLPRASYYITGIGALIVGLSNHYVLQFKGTDLLWSDIQSIPTAISVIDNYRFTVTPVVVTAILLLLCLILLQSTIDERGMSAYQKVAGGFRITYVAVGVLILFLVNLSAGIMIKRNEKAVDLFVVANNFKDYGWSYANVFLLQASDVKKPDNYSDKQVENILATVEAEEQNPQVTPQNLIVIMNESFSDLSVVGQLTTNQDYMPFIRNLTENTVKGNLHVSTFGGYTCITEYEFLTGNSQHFLPPGSKPYMNICRDHEEGMVKILQAQGYHAVAMHPYGSENWNRDQVYPAYGFDEFLSLEEYEGYDTLRKYISDKGDYQKIIDYYEQHDKNEKLFIFNVTMQNHSNYDINNGTFEESITIENFESSVGNTYLSLVKESDDAFAYLLSYFNKVEEPTMIVMFGDHQPALSDHFYEKLYGKELDTRNDYEKSLQYITPYLIWTNYDSDFEKIGDTSANYLGSYVMECAGVEMPEYSRFLLQQRETVPVMGMYGIHDAEGNFITYGDVPDEQLNAYANLQYMRVEDRESRLYDIFKID